MGERGGQPRRHGGEKRPSRQRGVFQREGCHHADGITGRSLAAQIVTLTTLEGPLCTPAALTATTSKYQVPEFRFGTT